MVDIIGGDNCLVDTVDDDADDDNVEDEEEDGVTSRLLFVRHFNNDD